MSRRRATAMLLRLAVLALLALGLCLQPVLATLGEAHELAAHAAQAATHAHVHADAPADSHADGHAEVAAPPADAGRAPEPESPSHLLMHLAHCCGQSASVLPPLLPKLAAPAGLRVHADAVQVLALNKRPNRLQRPPIAA